MDTLQITITNPKLLTDGLNLIPAIAAKVEPLEHQHASEPTEQYTNENLRIRMEAMTPLLREIIYNRPPEHWGINE